MRVAVLFLAGMAFVAGFNQRAQKLDKQSKETIPAATAEEFAAYRQRWQANLRAGAPVSISGDLALRAPE